QILSYLSPADLLHLARSYPALRAFVLSKQSLHIWKNARSNVEGLPPCPKWLSEPRYASLCFDSHCDDCLAEIGSAAVVWQFAGRYCLKCR
ncbi:hypothetical protein C8Q76DRAFT_567737, partial [Earliella scabrosa]